MGIVGMLVFIPLLSVLYTIFREFVYLRLKKYQAGDKDRNRGIYRRRNTLQNKINAI